MAAKAKSGTTFPARRLGSFLRQLREESQNTVAGSAEAMEWSRNKLYQIEAGQSILKGHELVSLCAVYGVTHANNRSTVEALLALLSEAKERGYYHAYGEVIPEWFELYVGLERAASRLRTYSSLLVPGLLQTREYAKSMIGLKPGRAGPEIHQMVNLRLERQKLLSRRAPKAPLLEVIIEEHALRRPMADDGMRRQLDHLLTAGHASNVCVRVLPASVGPHRAIFAGFFTILEFPMEGARPADPPTVYLESLTGALYLDKPPVVETYQAVWLELEDAALAEEPSRHFIRTMIEETA